MMEPKTLEDYMALEYPIEIRIVDDGIWLEYPDLKGCGAWGETFEEAKKTLDEIKEIYISHCLEYELDIPLPEEHFKAFNGRILLRVSTEIHRKLSRMANRHKISLNRLLNNIISEEIGYCSKSYKKNNLSSTSIYGTPEIQIIDNKTEETEKSYEQAA